MTRHTTVARRVLAILAALSLTAGFSITARANGIGTSVTATFVVRDANDVHDLTPNDLTCDTPTGPPSYGKCTPRAAIDTANAHFGSDLVFNVIVPAGHYYLSSAFGPLTIDHNTVNILGNGSTRTIFSGPGSASAPAYLEKGASGSFRACYYGTNSVFENNANLTIQAVEIRDGSHPYGGGVINHGSLILSYDLIDCNEAQYGGGVNSAQGNGQSYQYTPMSISNTEISFNYAQYEGAGVRNKGGRATMDTVNLHDNYSGVDGGGAANSNYLSINNSNIHDNQAGDPALKTSSGYGGGIENTDQLQVTVTKILHNLAGNAGGGLDNYGGTGMSINGPGDRANLDKVTMSGNVAGVYGGAATNDYRLSITRSTLSGNVAGTSTSTGYGGAIYNARTSSDFYAPLWLTNTLVDGNKALGSGSKGGGLGSNDENHIVNTTFSNNSAYDGGGFYYIAHPQSSCPQCSSFAAIQGSTFAKNKATHDGGGIYVSGTDFPGPVQIANTLITQNTAGNADGGLHNEDAYTVVCSGTTSITGNTPNNQENAC